MCSVNYVSSHSAQGENSRNIISMNTLQIKNMNVLNALKLSKGGMTGRDIKGKNMRLMTQMCSKETANEIYSKAGQIMIMQGVKIPVSIRGPISVLIYECLQEFNISFKLNDMQLRAIHSIANFRDTFVISPCGTGKLLVYFLAVAILRKIGNQPNGIGQYIYRPHYLINNTKSL